MSLPQLGRYQIIATLGRGAMGVVYKAHDPLIERTVAIKTVACAGLPDKEAEEFEQRFFREAKSAGRLNHPNIVTIHDIGRSDGLAWIAMEFLSGRSLRDILDVDAPLSCALTVELAAAVADGLAFAHAQGIVHRDIKPANIMVLDNGTVKITDFGIAQLPGGSLTMAGAVLGSPRHMSPEQVAGHKADGRADIFSLGTVLYEMLTGQPPFSGDNMHATMYQVVHKMPPAPSGCCAGLPTAFDAIVARALAKDPADRYQNAAEMAADLRQAAQAMDPTLSGEAGGEAPPPAPAAAGPTPGRKLRYGLAAAGLLLAAGAAFVLLRPAPPATGPGSTAAAPATTPAPRSDSNPADGKAGNNAERPPERKPVAEAAKTAKAATPSAPTTSAAPAGWQAALRAELKACEEQSVFKRVVCVEKARWKHCPGHWGSSNDCPANAGEQKSSP